MTTATLLTATPESIDRVVKMVRTRAKTGSSAMQAARETMESEVLALGAASALTTLRTEYDALPKDKRAESPLKDAIRAVYKDMSTAVSHERAALRKELNDETAETAALHKRFPWRILALKGCYTVMTHAEFDAETANRRKSPAKDANDGDGDGDVDDAGDGSAKGMDKAAAAIAALELALAAMTAERDAWRARAETAESELATLRAPVAAKPKAKGKPAKAKTAAIA